MINLLYIDLFCGAGGTSSGVEYARLNGRKCAKVIACVNHDENAIKSHAANHPHTLHFTEDIRTLELGPLVNHLTKMKRKYPKARTVLWASLECTNFSRAKGGQPRDADSRTLAEHLFRYIEALCPDYIQIENVEEFMCWGDLDENGKPVSKHKGSDYLRWVKHVCQYGYIYDYHLLNAADFGAYTSRKRFFGQFARKGLPIAFPAQTHAKAIVPSGSPDGRTLFPKQYRPWKPVREVLDLQDEGSSIFNRKKPLCEKTLERIYAGLVKFVAGGKENFLVKWNSMKEGRYRAPSIEEPCPTLPCRNTIGLVKAQFLSKQFSGDPMSKNQSIDRPAGTITCKDHHAFVTAYYGNGFNSSVEEPAPTVTTKDRMAVVNPQFIVNYRFNNKGSSVDEPAPTICTVGQIGVANCQFLDSQYGNGTSSSIDAPSPTVVNNPKQSLVSVKPWIMNTNFGNIGSSVDDPSPVITANRKWHYLMNPQFASKGGSIEDPCFTLIARMDKMPPYLVSTVPEGSPSGEPQLAIVIYDTDSPMTRKVKQFMAAYGIIDIRMRMLKISELKRIMGFPDSYILIGTQAEQKKFIGNAVEVNMSRVLCEALADKLMKIA